MAAPLGAVLLRYMFSFAVEFLGNCKQKLKEPTGYSKQTENNARRCF